MATARNPESLRNLATKGAITKRLDVTASDASLAETVEEILSKTGGRIDVLVNNAGYVLSGGVEEYSRDEVQAQFDTNVFGQINMIRAVLPVMRRQRAGVIANLGSIAGWYGSAGAGLYCATKACAGMVSEAMGIEVAHLGIRVICVEPGYFRTDLLGGRRLRARNVIEDLKEGVNPAIASLDNYNLRQPGDPKKGARLVVDALTGRGSCQGLDLPPRLLIGQDAYDIVLGVIDKNRENFEAWRRLATSTDYDVA